jgi:hypothetical protein
MVRSARSPSPPALTWRVCGASPSARVRPARSWPWLVALQLAVSPPGITGVLMLNLALPVALYAAVRFGPRGAATAGALAALVVAVAATRGIGPFGDVPRAEAPRGAAVELTFATFRWSWRAIAERQSALASGMRSEVTTRSNRLTRHRPSHQRDSVYLDFIPGGRGVHPEEVVGKQITNSRAPLPRNCARC